MTAPKGMALGSPRLAARLLAQGVGGGNMLSLVAAAWGRGQAVSEAAARDARTGLAERSRMATGLHPHRPYAVGLRLTLRLYDREMAPAPKGRGRSNTRP